VGTPFGLEAKNILESSTRITRYVRIGYSSTYSSSRNIYSQKPTQFTVDYPTRGGSSKEMQSPHRGTVDLTRLRAEIHLPSLVGQYLTVKKMGSCYKTLCPFHNDKNTPSLVIYNDHMHCFGCGKHLNAVSFIMEYLNLSFGETMRWFHDKMGTLPTLPKINNTHTYTGSLRPIDNSIITYWNQLANRDYYHQRLLTDETIDFFQLGWSGTAHTIPLWEGKPGESDVLNVKYRRHGSGKPKYWGDVGRNQPRLFNRWVLDISNEIVIFLGEFDAILGYQDGLSTVSPTGGQLSWQHQWNKLFNGHTVYVVPDVGEKAAGYRIVSELGAKLCLYPEGDWTDYTDYRREHTVDDFRRAVLDIQPHKIILPAVEPYWEMSNVRQQFAYTY